MIMRIPWLILAVALLGLQTPEAPSLTLRTCAVAAVATPPSAGRWKVQWFDGATALTNASYTYRRTLTLTSGTHSISLRWTKSGAPTVTSEAITRVCTLP